MRVKLTSRETRRSRSQSRVIGLKGARVAALERDARDFSVRGAFGEQAEFRADAAAGARAWVEAIDTEIAACAAPTGRRTTRREEPLVDLNEGDADDLGWFCGCWDFEDACGCGVTEPSGDPRAAVT